MLGLSNPLHILFLMVLLLLVFGAKRLPETGRSLGAGLRDFRDSLSGDHALPAPPATGETAALLEAAAPPAPVAQKP